MKKPSKVFGWMLLIFGVAIIFWALIASYNIFTAKTDAPQLFEVEKSVLIPTVDGGNLSPEEMQKEMMGEQMKEILPVGTVPILLNMVAWSILAGIMIFGGGQIAGIGIKLISVKANNQPNE